MQSLWMIVAGFFFALMGVCVKFSGEMGYSLVEIVFYRSMLALLITFSLARWRKIALATPHWRWQLKRGVTGFVSLSVFFYTISLLPLGTAVTLNYTSPIFLMLLLMYFRGLKFNWGILCALILGFVGVVCLLHPSFEGEVLFGVTIAILSAILAAMAYFDVSDLGRRGEPETRTVLYFSIISALLSLFWAFFSHLHPITPRGFLALVGVGICATLGQLTMTRAYARGKVLLSASLAYTTVVFAAFFGVILWGERLGWMECLGIALIIASGIAANSSRSQEQGGKKMTRTH